MTKYFQKTLKLQLPVIQLPLSIGNECFYLEKWSYHSQNFLRVYHNSQIEQECDNVWGKMCNTHSMCTQE